jgi:hypothetical protein
MIKNCKWCDSPITNRGNTTFCSIDCNKQYVQSNKVEKPNCKWCGIKLKRTKGVFCSRDCKGEYQRTLKPVDRDWLYEKYFVEGLGTYQIGKIVNRNPKNVYRWLKDYKIPIRKRGWEVTINESIPYHDKEWLKHQYITLKKSSKLISDEVGTSENNILHFLNKFDIIIRSMKEIRKMKHWGQSGKDNPMFGRDGKDNPNWKGGSTPERQSVYVSQKWKSLVSNVWKRDKGKCIRCGFEKGNTKKEFHIHHIIPFSNDKGKRTDIDNLVLLCKSCHNYIHSKKNVKKEYLIES